MNLNYQITNSDLLTYHLYISSKSGLHKKRRFRSRIIVPVIYIGFGFYLYYKNQNTATAIVLIGIGILWFAFYPMYSKRRYKRYFQKYIEKNYKDRINKTVEINIDEDSLNTKDFSSESKIKGKELRELIETKHHFFIKLTTDLSFIIPKKAVADQTEFKKMITNFGVVYVNELNWEWK